MKREPCMTEELGRCTECGEEVYKMEKVYDFRSGFVHEECLLPYAKKFFEEDKKQIE